MMRTSRQKRQAGSRTFKRVAKLEDCPELQRPVVYVNTDIVWERGDVGYWNPRWVELEPILRQCPHPVQPLGDFIPETVQRNSVSVPGITYGQVGGREYPPSGTSIQYQNGSVKLRLPGARAPVEGVLYLQVRNLRRTGIDPYETAPEKRFIAEGSYNDLLRSRIQVGDLLIVNSGIGSLGRCSVLPDEFPYKLINISQDITRIILNGIRPEWCCIYLQTDLGAHQIVRLASGVSGQIKIDFDELKSIEVVKPPDVYQQVFAQGMNQMHAYHLRALQAKSTADESEYLRCRQIATGILEILIWQAEQVARSASFVPKAVFPEGVEEALTRLLEDECHRLGAMIEQVDIRPQILELQSRPLGIPLERDSKVASEVERLVRWIHAFWEYRDGKTR
jgi:hypothetical protein